MEMGDCGSVIFVLLFDLLLFVYMSLLTLRGGKIKEIPEPDIWWGST